MRKPALELKNISKYMDDDFSLDNVNIDLFHGEVHALMGENGSGKSLIVKIINGIVKKDSGDLFIDGKEIIPESVYIAKKSGIHSVLQDVALFPNLSVAENVFADQLPLKNNFLHSIDFNTLYHDCDTLFKSLGININPHATVNKLGSAQKHLIEMVKAYITEADIIIFDEPSAAFTVIEKEILYKVIHDLKKRGKAILYITHFFDEIEKIADRISFIHQGKLTATKEVKDISNDEIIRMISKSIPKNRYPKLEIPLGKTLLSVRNLYYKNILADISFDLKKSEIIGITGLVGSGRSILAQCLFGILTPSQGEIELDGKPVHFKNPEDAIKSGIAYLSEERIDNSIFGCLNLEENVSISALKRFVQHNVIDPYILSEVSSTYVEKLSIKPGKSGDIINTYSGGNQQKMAVARWLMSRQRIYILDEPTLGVDIASKTDLYNCMVDMVRKGASILFISSDIDEILGMCDRILVLNDGKLVYNSTRKQASKELILKSIAAITTGN